MTRADFWSVVVPYYKNKQYLPQLVESIHEHADMPFEIVVHNDSAKEPPSFDDLKISIQIKNYGLNLGLSRALHNAVSVSSGEWILFLNQDVVMVRSCLKLLRQILAKPYVGLVMVQDFTESSPEYCEVQDGRFSLFTGIGGGAAMAFRRNFWNEVGGTDLNADSGRCDTTVIYRMYKSGYWRAMMIGPKCFRNLSLELQQNRDTSIGPYGTDCSFPRIWPLTESDYLGQSKARMSFCCEYVSFEEHQEAGASNMTYWHNYSETLMARTGAPSTINWENAKVHGQSRWESQIKAEKWIGSEV